MFHYTNFGICGGVLRRFADTRGFVPEPGDHLADFTYPSGWFDDVALTPGELEEDWRGFCAYAEAETAIAREKLVQWRTSK